MLLGWSHLLILADGFNPFNIIEEALISFLLLIDAKIYSLFAYLFNLFMSLAQARIFDISSFDAVIHNLYLLFGVVALFLLAFSLLQAIINPDDMNKTTSSIKHIITRIVLAVFLTSITPFMFDFLYDFQNSILSYQVIPRATLGIGGSVIQNIEVEYCNGEKTSDGGCNGTIETELFENYNVSDALLRSNGYRMGFYVLKGFLSPTNPGEDVVVKGSKYFTKGDMVSYGVIGCAVGGVLGVIVGGVLTLTGVFAEVGIPLTVGGVSLLSCVSSGLSAAGAVGVGYLLTPENFSWNTASLYIMATGDFDIITNFSTAISEGTMSYSLILSTISGVILLYMMFSFCIDLGIRAAKLVFYQLMAPISFLLSAIPDKKELMSNWFKTVLTTWAEVFIRVFCLCTVALLASKVSEINLSGIGLIAKAIVILGLIAFAKQIPNLIGDITGIKSGNMKLGIKDKLAAGGAFTAGAIIGGGATALLRNATNTGQNMKNKYQEARNNNKGRLASIWNTRGALGKGIVSTVAGGASGAVRSGKAGWGAKSGKDMKAAGKSGAQGAVDARVKRANYKAAHSAGKGFWDDLYRSASGHVDDALTKGGDYMGIKNIEQLKRENYAMDMITSARDTFDNDIDSFILKEMAKGKTTVDGLDNANFSFLHAGEDVDFTAIQKAKDDLDDAKLGKRGAKSISDAERDYNNALKEQRLKLQNALLVSDEHWKEYLKKDPDLVAKIAALRVDALKYSGAIRNNSSLEPLVNSGIIGADYANNVDVRIGENHGGTKGWDDATTIDGMNKAIKRQKGVNNVAITQKEQQKYEDKK